jgi:hypothetical protein
LPDCWGQEVFEDVLNCRVMARYFLLIGWALLVTTGCDTGERLAKLEKQNQELLAEVKKGQASADFDLQGKCSKDARTWFNETWSRDKDTILLDFSNHYNKKENKCFILVEYHYKNHFEAPGGSAWTNHMTLWDVYENTKYSDFAENHYTVFKPKVSSSDEMILCETLSAKCKTVDEFNNFTRPYMND